MSNSAELTLNILRLLSHKVRNPLNVISNDLNYLKVSYPNENCDRSLARCRQIADFFRPVDLIEVAGRDRFDLSQLIYEVFTERSELSQELILEGSCRNIRQALIWLDQLFEIVSIRQEAENLLRFNLQYPVELSGLTIPDLYAASRQDQNLIPFLTQVLIESAGLIFNPGDRYFDLSRQ